MTMVASAPPRPETGSYTLVPNIGEARRRRGWHRPGRHRASPSGRTAITGARTARAAVAVRVKQARYGVLDRVRPASRARSRRGVAAWGRGVESELQDDRGAESCS